MLSIKTLFCYHWIMKNLKELFSEFPFELLSSQPVDLDVRSIKSDSRKVGQGDLFVALTGEYFDGHKYISSAVAQGAVAVVGERPFTDMHIPYWSK